MRARASSSVVRRDLRRRRRRRRRAHCRGVCENISPYRRSFVAARALASIVRPRARGAPHGVFHAYSRMLNMIYRHAMGALHKSTRRTARAQVYILSHHLTYHLFILVTCVDRWHVSVFGNNLRFKDIRIWRSGLRKTSVCQVRFLIVSIILKYAMTRLGARSK